MMECSLVSHFTTDQQFATLQDSTFLPEKIRQEQFNSWKQAFFKFEGGYPDPLQYSQDASEYNRVWNGLVKIPDEQLKLKFTNMK